jgi:hypothetical protein
VQCENTDDDIETRAGRIIQKVRYLKVDVVHRAYLLVARGQGDPVTIIVNANARPTRPPPGDLKSPQAVSATGIEEPQLRLRLRAQDRPYHSPINAVVQIPNPKDSPRDPLDAALAKEGCLT